MSTDALLEACDEALLRAKRQGKGTGHARLRAGPLSAVGAPASPPGHR